MALPVSAEYPLVPFMQYDQMQPPLVPNVTVPGQVSNILPMVSAAVANEAGIKASANAARMFCYNLLVNNYWNNPEFAEVVRLSASLVCKNYLKQLIRMPESGIREAVEQVLTLYTSNLLLQYQDLKHMVTPQLLNAAYQNVSTFNNLKEEIISMQNNNMGFPNNMGGNSNTSMGVGYPMHNIQQPMQQNPGNMQIAVMQTPQGPVQVVMTPNGYVPLQQFQNQMQPQIMPHPNMMPMHNAPVIPQMSNYPVSNSTFSSPSFNNGQSNHTSIASNNNGNGLVDERYGARIKTPDHVQQQVAVQVPVQRETEPVKQLYLEIDKGSEMDRSKHQTQFFNGSFEMDTTERTEQLTANTNAFIKAVPIVTEASDQYVYPSLIMETSIDSAVTTSKIKQLTIQTDSSPNNVFRTFAAIATPMFCISDVKDYMEALRSATSFNILSVKMKTLAMALASKKDETGYCDNLMTVLSEVDNTLTSIVNEYLKCSLKVSTTIDSFVEDISALPDYLYRKFGIVYSEAFGKYESDVMDSITENFEAEAVDQLLDQYDTPESVSVGLLPINCSITFLCLLDKELGYKVGEDPVIIDPHTAPTLFKLAKSLIRHKKDMSISTVYDFIITSDNVRYKLYRNGTVNEEFLIGRV